MWKTERIIMRLSKLIPPNDGAALVGEDRDVTGITADSRAVKSGYLFVAIPGVKHDGAQFIADAVRQGAAAILAPEGLDIAHDLPIITTPDVRKTLSGIAARFYPRQPRLIAAVTGTSGKTSTAQFTRELWNLNGHRAASIGTLGLITPTENRYGSLTTPDAITLHRLLDEVANADITHLAMEASSHGLAMHRLDAVRLQVAAFTNLSRDHLDFHPNMEEYFATKLRLFTHILPRGCVAVLNADIPEFQELHQQCHLRGHKIISYGKRGHDIQLQDHQPHPQGQRVKFTAFGTPYEVLLPIIGEFQVWNSLCALGMVVGSGDPVEKAVASLAKLSGVPGRLELIGKTQTGGAVFVDYAHKPDALEHVLTALRPHVAAQGGAKLHVVFGCGGNRDIGKRPLMGAIAQRLADTVTITDDNPRDEMPALIRQAIIAGCAATTNLREIGDRAQAIAEAIATLRTGDVLVIAGKGHEKGQIVGDNILPFDDGEVARQALQKA